MYVKAFAMPDSLLVFLPFKDLSLKTKEVLATLASLTEVSDGHDRPTLNAEALKQKRYPPATENFLFHLAAAEKMLKI